MAEAFSYIGAMFGAGAIPFISLEFFFYLKDYGFILIIAILGSTPLAKNLIIKLRENSVTQKITDFAEPVFLLLLMLIMTAYLVDGSFNPFLYFRF